MSSILENLIAMRTQIDSLIASASTGVDVAMPMLKGKKEKKPRANAGQSTLHGAWTKHVMALHDTKSAEYARYLEDRLAQARAGKLIYNETYTLVKDGKKSAGDPMTEDDAKRGAHIAFVSHWRKEHAAEFEEFKSSWEAANPKESRAASSKSSVVDGEESDSASAAKQPKKRGAKKDSERSPEDLAAVKAKRAAKKAEKAAAKTAGEVEERESSVVERADSPVAVAAPKPAPEPVAAPVPEPEAEEEEEGMPWALQPFTHKKINYLRLGDPTQEDEWHEDGDLWLAKPDGSKGAYAGQLKSSGKIDNSPATMAGEPDIA